MTSQAMDVPGKSYVREDGIEMVAGTTRYVDYIEPADALYGAVVRTSQESTVTPRNHKGSTS